MALGGHFDVLVPDHPNGALPFRRCRILLLDTQRQAATETVSALQVKTTPESLTSGRPVQTDDDIRDRFAFYSPILGHTLLILSIWVFDEGRQERVYLLWQAAQLTGACASNVSLWRHQAEDEFVFIGR